MEACCCPSLVELHFPMVFIENELQAGRFLIVLVSPEERRCVIRIQFSVKRRPSSWYKSI
jgi:hypothetical protein